MRARSTAASVCPARTSTPPERARSGKTWPGRARSRGVAPRIDRDAHRRARDRPPRRRCDVPCFASIDTHIAVSRRDELSPTSSGISSSSSRSGVIARQTSPRPCLHHEVDRLGRHLRRGHRQIAFVLAILVVDDDDHRPARMASSAASIGRERRALARPLARCNRERHTDSGAGSGAAPTTRPFLEQPRDVLAEHVGFEIDGIARVHAAERRVRERERHDLDADPAAARAPRSSG